MSDSKSEVFDVTNLRNRRAEQRWNRMSVGDIFERVTWSTPDKEALIGWEGTYSAERFSRVTYREADQYANQIAHALIADGLEPGDRVLMFCDNGIEALLCFFGIAKAGCVAVPLNPNLAEDVLSYECNQAQPAIAITESGLFARGANVLANLGISRIIRIEIGEGEVPGSVSFEDWIRHQPTSEVDVTIHGDDIWELLYTSGTTSMPKASMSAHSYSYLSGYAYAMSLTRGLDYETDIVMASFLPIVYHCGHNSTVMPALFAGGTVVVGRKPNEVELAQAITRERVTALWAGSPLWIEKLVDVAEHDSSVDLESLTVVMFSWGAMAPDLAPRLKSVCNGVQMLGVFGQTESQSCLKFWPDREPAKAQEALHGVNHVGRPTPILAADIHDPEGNSLYGMPGVPGEAVYRSPFLTAGYYQNLEATKEAFRDGWFHSGDSCIYNDDGSQVMVDRFKDIVKSGGENVSSLRVEAVIQQHPDVAKVAVIGIPDQRWGELVTAVVVPQAGSEIDEADLISFARERLAGFETPKRVISMESLPESIGGKVLKYKLREIVAAQ